jgi:predicted NAD/FAD-binding protein
MNPKKKIAIIGSGISGLSAAYFLKDRYDVTIYEKNDRLGGHSRTIKILDNQISVDTGFIVLNDRNYPNLNVLFSEIGIDIVKTEMSFAMSVNNGELEWSGDSLDTLFAQRKNLFNFKMLKGVFDILKFNKNAVEYITKFPNLTLAELIDKMSLGEWFKDYYIVPMGGAIWSCPYIKMMDFPASSFVNFFHNHGLLTINNRPTWYTLKNKSIDYVTKLEKLLEQSSTIIKNSSIKSVKRTDKGVEIKRSANDKQEDYDEVIFACHPVEILSILTDSTTEEKNCLEQFSRQENIVYTHCEENQMPKIKKCWSSWNYIFSNQEKNKPNISVTYWMNKLQHIPDFQPVFVTLNPISHIPEDKIYDVFKFFHPVFDYNSIVGQEKIEEIQGKNKIWYCGAYLRYGFHEDGIWSAKNILGKINAK